MNGQAGKTRRMESSLESWSKMMPLKVVTVRNLRGVYRVLSTKLSNELNDNVIDRGIKNDEIAGLVTPMSTDIIN